jgi:hypothetical protein
VAAAGDTPATTTTGSTRASRVGCGALAATVSLIPISKKVRDREVAITSTRRLRQGYGEPTRAGALPTLKRSQPSTRREISIRVHSCSFVFIRG